MINRILTSKNNKNMDLMVAAVNEANKKVDDMMAQEMSKITGGMHLPGMF